MHVVAIRDTGSLILGQRDLELDAVTGLREVSHRGGGTVWLYEGGLRLRPATAEESCTLPVMSVRAASSSRCSPGSALPACDTRLHPVACHHERAQGLFPCRRSEGMFWNESGGFNAVTG